MSTPVRAAVALVIAFAALAPGSPSHGGARRAPDAPMVPLGAAVYDGFEVDPWPDPGLWRLPPDTTPMWWPSSCQAYSGARALWAFGGPTIRGDQPCDAAAPAGTSNDLIMNLDLRDARLATRLDLYFALWLKMPPGEDQGLFIHLLVPRAEGGYERVPVFGATGTSGLWGFPPRRLDLLALADIEDPDRVYDLRGGFWRLEWTALAPHGTPSGGGIFIDDVSLVWEPDPAVPTPTVRPRPSATATASSTVPPTATRTATATRAAPTSTPTPAPAYLPVTMRLHPEPSPTATRSPEPEATATATQLPTEEPG